MTGQELKILFKHNKAYLMAERPMTFDQLDLPEVAKSFKSPAYWTIRVLNYSETEKKIFCEILSYQNGETEFGYNQQQLSDKLTDLQNVTFRSIDTTGLLRTLAGKAPVSIFPPKHVPVDRTQNHFQSEPAVRQPFKQIIDDTFLVPLKKVHFKLGGVSFNKKFKEHKKTLELTIPNSDIREEFDAVKNYFANVLKTKKIQVTVKIKITDNEITSIEAKSPEIDKIDKNLIDNVKFEFVKATTKKKINIDIDKSLFTMDEYFDTFADEKFESTTFYNNEKELFEDLLKISNTKHYKHLRFLSSKHCHEIMKLRFVHKPLSFIFLIQGDRNYHIVWETLDTSEATYIWHEDKKLDKLKIAVKKINDIINVIKAQGKIAYINTTNDNFRRIYHDYSEPVEVDGFVKWKGELEDILT